MKLTEKWLNENKACAEGVEWFLGQKEIEVINVLRKLLWERHLFWANWLVVRKMTHRQKIQYAVFASEQVLHIYEKEYPDDKRPRQAIEAAKRVLKNNTQKNRDASAAARVAASAAAWVAGDAASAAARAAWDAWDAAWDAARAAMFKQIIEYGVSLVEEKCEAEDYV